MRSSATARSINNLWPIDRGLLGSLQEGEVCRNETVFDVQHWSHHCRHREALWVRRGRLEADTPTQLGPARSEIFFNGCSGSRDALPDYAAGFADAPFAVAFSICCLWWWCRALWGFGSTSVKPEPAPRPCNRLPHVDLQDLADKIKRVAFLAASEIAPDPGLVAREMYT